MGAYENALGTPSAPPAPTNLAATVGNSVVNLSWTGNDYVTSYSVYRSTTSGSGFTAIATGLSTNSYENTGLTNETTYYYKVSATGNGGESDLTAEISAKPKAQKYTVKTDGSGDYTVIQTAINATTDADTVLVYAGTYTENINYNGKNIAVIGEDRETTIIDGNQNGSVVTFANGESSAAVLRGFTITNGLSSDAGGIWCENSSPTISDLIISNNVSSSYNGGIGCQYSSPTITNVNITDNSSYYSGGGIGIRLYSNPTIRNVIISNNSGSHGGGLYIELSEPIMENIIIRNNSASGSGGGVRINNSSATLKNVTISDNTDSNGGSGIWCGDGGNPILVNCILWNNLPSEIELQNQYSSSLNVSYSDILGGWEGEGNINSDPLFVDAASGNYRLSDYSPAIGAGTATGAPTTDIIGTTRPTPSGSSPDMGAYENALSSPSAPPVPTNLAATVGNTLINLSWTGNNYATSYSVYRSTTSGSGFTAIATGLSTTSYQNTGLTNETTYYYKVSAIGAGGESDLTAEISAKPKAQKYTVKTDGSGDYTVIQTAIDAVMDGDTVLVYAGTYTENINFNGKNIVVGSLYLITSDTSYISSTIIDGNESGRVVMFNSGESSTTILIGFTIRNGLASLSTGGGILFTANSSPTLRYLKIVNNEAARGGGIAVVSNSNPLISQVTIVSNNASIGDGGGLIIDGSNPTLVNSLISNNNAQGKGGGVAVINSAFNSANPQITKRFWSRRYKKRSMEHQCNNRN